MFYKEELFCLVFFYLCKVDFSSALQLQVMLKTKISQASCLAYPPSSMRRVKLRVFVIEIAVYTYVTLCI